jgi:NDP-sugar pyrophosphorylase family protein
MTMPVERSNLYEGILREHSDKVGVCILAAGIAKRLEPISAIIAKPAFPLGGRIAIAELWVRKFVEAGLTKIAMNLHRVPESIRGHFGSGEKFGAEITYVDEASPSGTLGGALKMVRALQKKASKGLRNGCTRKHRSK